MNAKRPAKAAPGREDQISVRRVSGGGPAEAVFELVFPSCVDRRAADMREVHSMLEAGEIDVAVEELRWLLDGCSALLEAHKLLGQIALDTGDVALARGHFGRAWEIGMKALPEGRRTMLLPHAREANRGFLEAGSGLAHCLRALGEDKLAHDVTERLLALDPSDPLGGITFERVGMNDHRGHRGTQRKEGVPANYANRRE